MNVYQHVQATTASALTADEWRAAWMLAAPVVVAANRYVEAEKDGTPGLVEDAHFQLLRALTDYKATPGSRDNVVAPNVLEPTSVALLAALAEIERISLAAEGVNADDALERIANLATMARLASGPGYSERKKVEPTE